MKTHLRVDGNRIIVIDPEGKEKVVGDLHGKTLVTLRNPEKHLMRKWNAYGFNKVAVDSDLFDMIVIIFPNDASGFISVNEVRGGRVDMSMEGEQQYFVDANKVTMS